jgi:Asp-tRNA(Asn)/Glu-tRNA(Gln) amidotransferase A subunit family amidase
MRAVLERAHATEPYVHAYAHLDDAAALDAAAEADRMFARGDSLGPLHGVPIGIKDLIGTADLPTEAGSAVLRGHRAESDAETVRTLREAGALIVGKQQTHEFGFGMDEPPTRNPWDLRLYPGGSTAGGAVSVAVGSSLAAIGTDGGGSIRKPAAINGLVGFKPTFGLVSTEGMVPGSTSFDHIGWLTRTVEDAALLLRVLGNTADTIPDRSPTGLRIGCPSYFFRDLSPEIERAVGSCIQALADSGTTIVPVVVPELERSADIHGNLSLVEAYAHHASWVSAQPQLYHPGTLELLNSAAGLAADVVVEAERQREQLNQAMDHVYADNRLDALCTPTIPILPVALNEMDPRKLLPEYCRLTIPFNITGQPAASIPCGITSSGLPVGIQVAARRYDEAMVLRIGLAIEERVTRPFPRPTISSNARGSYTGSSGKARAGREVPGPALPASSERRS